MKTQKLILKTGQWWKAKEGKNTTAVVFHVLSIYKGANEIKSKLEVWDATGTKEIKHLSISPDDIDNFELCSKHEALARLL